ncbi:GNAT family N-acetyltransferase [Vibrio quintilis]|nr:GNAT family N-acetyltransferase [Vibrio quintilis]
MIDHMLQKYAFLPYSRQTLKRNLERFLSQQLSWCDDPDFSARFPFQETGLEQAFFQQKVIHVNGQSYLTGPRYLGGDINQPFIELIASTAPVSTAAARKIFSDWQPLQAQHIRVLRQRETGLSKASQPGTTDQLIYIAPIPHSSQVQNREAHVSLRLAQPADSSWCLEAMEQSYQETLHQLPALKSHLSPTDPADLSDAIANREAFMIESHGNPAGFIIASPDAYAFVCGYCVIEEVIVPACRGKNLAATAQQLLSRQLLPAPGHHLLVGTIARDNLPSRRTAEKAGRKALLEYAFLREADF